MRPSDAEPVDPNVNYYTLTGHSLPDWLCHERGLSHICTDGKLWFDPGLRSRGYSRNGSIASWRTSSAAE